MKKVTLLAIVLLVTNIHAVKLMKIVNHYPTSLKVYYARKTDGEEEVWDRSQYIHIKPNETKKIDLNWSINKQIAVRCGYIKSKNGGEVFNILTNCDDYHFTCEECVIIPDLSCSVVTFDRCVGREYTIFYRPNVFCPTLYVDVTGMIYLMQKVEGLVSSSAT